MASYAKYNPDDGTYSSTKPEVNPPDDMDIAQFMFEYKSKDVPIDVPSSTPLYIQYDTGKEFTLQDCKDRTQALSRAFHHEFNVGKDDVVVIFSPNCIDFASTCWSVFQLGGIVSAANPTYTSGELAYQITTVSKSFKVRAVITQPSALETTKKAMQEVGLDEKLIVLIDTQEKEAKGLRTIEGLATKYATSSKSFPRYKLTKGEARKKLAFLSFSSGTTGLPKAVMISHFNVIANVLQYNKSREGRYTPGKTRVLAVLPFYHIYGLVVVLHSNLFARCSIIILPKFELGKFCQLTDKYRVDWHYLVPPMVVLLTKSPEVKKYDLSAMRNIMVGAAPLDGATADAFQKLLPQADFGQGYGMTETSTVVTAAPSKEEVPNFPKGSIGILLPSVKFRIRTPEGKFCKPGEIGELCCFSPSNTLGYLNNEKATKDTYEDGWVFTGDEAYVRDDGVIFITDRIKELIKTKGMQVAPAELEGLLLTHDDVADACVVGIKDEYSGELPRAFVVLTQSAASRLGSDKEKLKKQAVSIQDYIKAKTVRYKHLSGGVEFIESIPKNPSGKLLRRILRDKANAKAKL